MASVSAAASSRRRPSTATMTSPGSMPASAAPLPGSAADDAGIEAGDVVVAVAGRPMADAAALTEAIAGLEPGEDVPVTVERGGTERTLTATLGSRGVEEDGG